jgi:TolB protein
LPGYTASPAWLPAGVIAFSKKEGVDKIAIYLIHTDGTGLIKLVGGPDPFNYDAKWSLDGTRIVYESGSNESETYNLWAINADGSGQVQLTHRPPAAVWPAWSPDGTRITFSALPSGGSVWHIGMMNADDSNQIMLTNNISWGDTSSSWTPNGTILFTRAESGGDGAPGDVFAINPDGTGFVQVTKLGYVGGYALSPDGTKMAIHNAKKHRIEIIPFGAVGSPVTLVNSDFGCVGVCMSWSPDGQALVMACSDWNYSPSSDLYIVKADGTSITTVPNIVDVFEPAWRPTK